MPPTTDAFSPIVCTQCEKALLPHHLYCRGCGTISVDDPIKAHQTFDIYEDPESVHGENEVPQLSADLKKILDAKVVDTDNTEAVATCPTENCIPCCSLLFPVAFVIIVVILILSISRSNSSGGGSHSSASGYGGRGGCFPGDSVVQIKKTDGLAQIIPVRDIQIGDEVRSGRGFSKVYAFGTKITNDENIPMVFIQTESGIALKATKNHFIPVYRENQGNEVVLVHDVLVGDLLNVMDPEIAGNRNKFFSQMPLTSRVIEIKEVDNHEGAYHPLTEDGFIVVNGIFASVHATDGVVPFIKVFGYEIVGIQGFQQLLYSPLRALCHISSENFCSDINHDLEDGSHAFLNVVEPMLRFLFPSASRINELHKHEEKANLLESSPDLVMRILFLSFISLSILFETLLVNGTFIMTFISIAFLGVNYHFFFPIKKIKRA